MSEGIPEPVRPVEPVYEDVTAQPDEPHDWYWPGTTDHDFCRKCEEMNCDCGRESCLNYPRGDLGCARNRAENRNWDRVRGYQKAMESYEAQMDYYRSLVGTSQGRMKP